MMDVSGVANQLRRSIHSGGRPPDNRQYGLQIFPAAHISIPSFRLPFVRAGIVKLFSQESSGPRRREGDHGNNSFEGRFAAKAKARVCFLQASGESPERGGGEAGEG